MAEHWRFIIKFIRESKQRKIEEQRRGTKGSRVRAEGEQTKGEQSWSKRGADMIRQKGSRVDVEGSRAGETEGDQSWS